MNERTKLTVKKFSHNLSRFIKYNPQHCDKDKTIVSTQRLNRNGAITNHLFYFLKNAH